MSNETNYNTEQLIAYLKTKHHPQLEELSKFIIQTSTSETRSTTSAHLYKNILKGIFITCFTLFISVIGHFSSINNIDPEHITPLYIAIGSLLTFSALTTKDYQTLNIVQLLMGKIILSIAWDPLFDNFWNFTLGLLLSTIISYPLYPSYLERFLSSLSVLISVSIAICIHHRNDIDQLSYLFSLYFLFQLIVFLFLLISPTTKHRHSPILYALSISLCILILGHFILNHTPNLNYFFKISTISSHSITEFALVFGLIALIISINYTRKQLKTISTALGCFGAILLGILSVKGALLSLIFIIGGRYKRQKMLTLIGINLLPIFLFNYYYDLKTTLLQKSILLIGSGFLLLAGGIYLNLKETDKDILLCEQK